ncbi:hypothetical protein [Bacillus sp. PK3_68]|uniref:hypothetical protein n=1 Tax=Bacillus sp. PK3_68 TaxID=2027408 RepID=UPI000E7659A2|nr:hypothetical protein [Bacillus sp. PK3_68]RJS61137.1 hypothetical protein CJ483_14670 [Bacillus sp. PK3_68]
MYVLNIENMFSLSTEEVEYEARDKEIEQQKQQLFYYFLRRAATLRVQMDIHHRELKRLLQALDAKGETARKKKMAYGKYELTIQLSPVVVDGILRYEEAFTPACSLCFLDHQGKIMALLDHGVIFYELSADLPDVNYIEVDNEPIYLDIYRDNDAALIEVRNAAHPLGIWNWADDYTKATEETAKALAKKLFDYPFYLHFEAYDDMKEQLLKEWQPYQIRYQDSKRTVLTMTALKVYSAEVPAFSLAICDEAALEKVFKELFYLPIQNEAFTLSQCEQMHYQRGYQFVDLKEDEAIIAFAHDAQGCVVFSNKASVSEPAHIKQFIPNSLIVQVT